MGAGGVAGCWNAVLPVIDTMPLPVVGTPVKDATEKYGEQPTFAGERQKPAARPRLTYAAPQSPASIAGKTVGAHLPLPLKTRIAAGQ